MSLLVKRVAGVKAGVSIALVTDLGNSAAFSCNRNYYDIIENLNELTN